MVKPIDKDYCRSHRLGQDPYEFNSLMRLAVDNKVRSYCEVGARWGGAFYAMVKNLPPDGGPYLAVDLPGAKFGMGGTLAMLLHHVGLLELTHRDTHVLIRDSQDPDTVAAITARGPFDMILIDADHTLDGVTKDWKNIGRHANKICALHDIVGDGRVDPLGNVQMVGKLWAQIQAQGYRTTEIINPGDPRRGIGVVWLQ